jgi:thiosulfate reductase/polysulfide reductase chain A
MFMEMQTEYQNQKRGKRMETIKSVCGQCHNSCRIIGTLENGRLVKVKGDPDDPRTQGALCSKGLSATQLAYDPRRLTYPLRRVGPRGSGDWERISWDDALTEVADTLKDLKGRYGPRSIGFFRGQAAGWGIQYLMLQRFCNTFGIVPGMGTSECFVPRVIGEVTTYGGMPLYSDYDNAKLLIFWGRQPAFSTAPLLRKIFDARDRGGKIVVIDPLQFHLGARADQFIFIEPGTDMALALAMLTVIVEKDLWDHAFVNDHSNDPGLRQLREHLKGGNRDGVTYSPEWADPITGIPAEVIRTLAHEYATTPGACIMVGHGIEGRINVTQTARAIALLRVVTGHIDQKGCDVLVPPSPNYNPKFFFNHLMEPGYQEPADMRLFGNSHSFVPEGCRYPLLFMMQGLHATPDVLRDLRNTTIKATFTQGGNPLRMLPNPAGVRDAFLRTELNVVCEMYPTEITSVADIVLPTASYLERTEPEWFKYDYALPVVNMRRQLIQIGECKSESQILVDLARKLGLEEFFPSADMTYYFEDLFARENFTYKELEKSENGIVFGPVMYNKLAQFGVDLPGGKVNIVSAILQSMGFDSLPVYYEGSENRRSKPDLAREYPLNALTGRAGPHFVHSQLRTIPWLREITPEPQMLMNPVKAHELGIKDNDMVLVESPRGSVKLKAQLTEAINPSSVYIPGGWEEANYNALGIEKDVCPISSQANYMQCLCRVSRISEGGH